MQLPLVRSIAVFLLPLALAACGGDDPAAPEQPQTPDPVVDEALVGEWLGVIQGTGGGMSAAADIRFELDAEGRMSASASNPPFHPIPTGSWGVAEGTFLANGVDTDGSQVFFEAPRSTTQLKGTWTSCCGAGTFTINKQ